MEYPLHEEDFEGFAILTCDLETQIVGDDRFVTNKKRLRKGVSLGAANAMLLRNWVRSLTTLEKILPDRSEN